VSVLLNNRHKYGAKSVSLITQKKNMIHTCVANLETARMQDR